MPLKTNPKIPVLFLQINKLQRKFFNEKLEKYNLSGAQHIIILKIYEYQIMTPKEIVELEIVEKSAITKNIKKLEELGYIVKVPSELDKRSYGVKVTKKGELIAKEIKTLLNNLNEEYEKFFNEEDIKKIAELLAFLNNKL